MGPRAGRSKAVPHSPAVTGRTVLASTRTALPSLLNYLAYDKTKDVVVVAAKNPRAPRHVLTLLGHYIDTLTMSSRDTM